MNKKNLILFFKVLVGIVILIFIFSKIPIADVWHSLKQTDRKYVAIAFFVLLAMRYVVVVRIKIFTNVHKMKISIQELFEIGLMASFYGLFLPGSLSGGAVRWYKISKVDNKPAESLTAIVYDRFIGTLGLVLIGIIFWLFAKQVQTNQEKELILFIALIALVAGYVLAFNGKVASFLIKMNDAMVFIPEFVREKIKKILVSSIDYRKILKRKHFEIVIVSILFEFCGILSLYLFSLSLDLTVTFAQIGWIRSIVLILSMLPISFAGIGVREGSLIFLLQDFGIEPASAIALSFLIFSGGIFLALCGGLIELKNILFPDNSKKIVATNKEVR